MSVEISYYDVRLVSLSQCRESECSGGGLYVECTTTAGSSDQ